VILKTATVVPGAELIGVTRGERDGPCEPDTDISAGVYPVDMNPVMHNGGIASPCLDSWDEADMRGWAVITDLGADG
jgi:hypothetical protein